MPRMTIRAAWGAPFPVDEAAGSAVSAAIARNWRCACLAAAGVFVTLLALFHSTVEHTIRTWYLSNVYNHGFLVPPIFIYLLWARRSDIAAEMPLPNMWGLALVAAGGATWLAGAAADVTVVRQFALVSMVQACSFTICGAAATRRMLFPLAFLAFAVPFGDELIPALQRLTATIAAATVRMAAFPVFVDGVLISTPSGDFQVADACAGLRYLISAVVLGVVSADVMFSGWRRRAVFVLLSAVVPVLANGVRAGTIILVANLSNGELAAGIDHVIYGWVFFCGVAGLLVLTGWRYRERGPRRARGPAARTRGRSPSPISFAAAGMCCVLAASAAPALLLIRSARADPVAPTSVKLELPAPSPRWAPGDPSWFGLPQAAGGADTTAVGAYRSSSRRAVIRLSYVSDLRRGSHLEDRAAALPDRWRSADEGVGTIEVDGHSLRVPYTRYVSKAGSLILARWEWIDGRFVGNAYLARLLRAKVDLFGGEPAAASVALAVEYEETDTNPEAVLREFVEGMQPLAPLLKRAAVE